MRTFFLGTAKSFCGVWVPLGIHETYRKNGAFLMEVRGQFKSGDFLKLSCFWLNCAKKSAFLVV